MCQGVEHGDLLFWRCHRRPEHIQQSLHAIAVPAHAEGGSNIQKAPIKQHKVVLTRLRAMLDLGLTWRHMAAPQDNRLCTQHLMQTPVSMRAGHDEAAVLHFDVCHSAGCRGCIFPSRLHACSPVARVTGFTPAHLLPDRYRLQGMLTCCQSLNSPGWRELPPQT